MERLDNLLKYHQNLCEQLKAHDGFNHIGMERTISKARKVEHEIEKELNLIEEE